MRYPDADIEVEYKKEKAKRKNKFFGYDEFTKVGLKEPKPTGAVPIEKEWDADAWNNSLVSTAPIVFEVS